MSTKILSGKALLFVEDQEQVSSMYKKAFEENGATVTVAIDGKSGIEHLTQHEFDLVILDRMLSEDMDGFQLLTWMREQDKTKNVPVIILSNLTAKDEDLSFIDSKKVAGYFVKADVSLDVLSRAFQSIIFKE